MPDAHRQFGGTVRRLCLAILWIVLFSYPISALEVPRLLGPVNDYAQALSESDRRILSDELLAKEKVTGNQIVILFVRTLQGEDVKEYSNRVFNTWKLGQKGKDNGVLLLNATEDRKIWIEVGYGLEGALPDGKVGAILDRHFVPAAKEGNLNDAVRDTVEAIHRGIRGEYPTLPGPGDTAHREPDDFQAGVIGLGLIVGFFVVFYFVFLTLWEISELLARFVTGAVYGFLCYWMIFWGWNDPAYAWIAGIIGFLVGAFCVEIISNSGRGGGGGSSGSSGGSHGGGGGSSYSGGGGSSGGGGAGRSY